MKKSFSLEKSYMTEKTSVEKYRGEKKRVSHGLVVKATEQGIWSRSQGGWEELYYWRDRGNRGEKKAKKKYAC